MDEWYEQQSGGVLAGTFSNPAIMGDPAEIGNGLVVVPGRRGDDVIFHFWRTEFPDNFGEMLYAAVEEVTGRPETFQAVSTKELAAYWTGEDLLVGEASQVLNGPVPMDLARIRGLQRMKTWALRCVGYVPVLKAWEEKLTVDLMQSVRSRLAA